MRADAIRRLHTNAIYECWWEREDYEAVVGFRTVLVDDDVDVFGQPMADPETQIANKREVQEPVNEMKPKVDRFNCDVVDPRNVFTSDEYTYTLQDKNGTAV
jgi:hypothetical protein